MHLELTPRKEKKMNQRALNRLREEGRIPAAVYGKSLDSACAYVSSRGADKWNRGAIYDVLWNDHQYSASVSELQRDPVTHQIRHVSFHLVGKNEVTTFDVPVKTVGNPPGVKAGGMLGVQFDTLALKGKPADIPAAIEVNVAGLELNGKITISDIHLAPGLEWAGHDADQAVVVCTPLRSSASEAEAAAVVETTEGAATEEVKP